MELLSMTTRRTFLRTLGGLSAWAATFSERQAFANPGQQSLAVVVAKSSAISELSLYELKQLYLGDKMQGPDGKRFTPLNRGASTPERIGFDRSVLGMSPQEAARYWIDRRIRGQSGAPKAIDPGLVLQRILTRLPGSVGYVFLHEVTSEVKVLRIDGRMPGDAGYPAQTAHV
jgi:hypothetical protein